MGEAVLQVEAIKGFTLIDPSGRVLSFPWACGPPIDMNMWLSCACTLMERGRRRSVYTLDHCATLTRVPTHAGALPTQFAVTSKYTVLEVIPEVWT